jgi:hypothetical protein
MKKVNVLKTGIMVAAMVAALPLSAFAATGGNTGVDIKVYPAGTMPTEYNGKSIDSYPQFERKELSVQESLAFVIQTLELDSRTEKKINDMIANLKPEQITSEKLREIVKSLKLDPKTEKVLNETFANIIDSQTIKADKTGNVKVELLDAGTVQFNVQDGHVMLKNNKKQ